jgi:hypothetical protein
LVTTQAAPHCARLTDRKGLVTSTIAVIVEGVASLGHRRALLCAASGREAVHRTDPLTSPKTLAAPHRARCAHIEAFVRATVAVFVLARPAELDPRETGFDPADGPGAVRVAHLRPTSSARADADLAGCAGVEALIGRPVTIVVRSIPADFDCRETRCRVTFGPELVKGAGERARAHAESHTDGAGRADVVAFVRAAVAVVVLAIAAALLTRRHNLSPTVEPSVRVAGHGAVAAACADADRARTPDIEALVRGAIAVVV